MKILIDNSNLFAGGGIQVATSFLYDLQALNENNTYYVVQSVNSAKQVNKDLFDKRFFFYDLTEKHQSIVNRVKELKQLEKTILPDCVFTVFGPSYHKSACPKIVGFAIPHIIYPNSPFFSLISNKEKLKLKVLSTVKNYFFKKNSNALIYESNDANLICTQKYKTIKGYTVSNTLNSIFLNKDNWSSISIEKSRFNILYLTANYPHKNIAIIPEVIDQLLSINSDMDFRFYLSVTKDELNFSEKYNKYINYLGRVEINQVPLLYKQMDLLFMPTLLEVFSTSYLEAMFSEIPIVASDMSFARDICSDAALYCEPTNAKDYANKIYMIYEDTNLSKDLVDKGIKNFTRFGNSMDRTKAYLTIIKETIDASNKK